MTNVSLRLLVLKTDRVAVLCNFYGALGVKFKKEQHGNGPVHYSAQLDHGILEVYPLSDGERTDSTLRLGFSLADPDSCASDVQSHGGKLIRAGRETRWGYLAIVSDPDGRIIELYRS